MVLTLKSEVQFLPGTKFSQGEVRRYIRLVVLTLVYLYLVAPPAVPGMGKTEVLAMSPGDSGDGDGLIY